MRVACWKLSTTVLVSFLFGSIYYVLFVQRMDGRIGRTRHLRYYARYEDLLRDSMPINASSFKNSTVFPEEVNSSALYNIEAASFLNSADVEQTRSPPEKVQLIIFAYLRTGSSFFGDMFQLNPEAFYMFEPLDAYYSAHYGTTDGFNVAADLFHYANGSARAIPEEDKKGVPQFLYNLLTCNVEVLPPAFLMHGFYTRMSVQYTYIADYRKCISNLQICSRYKISLYCGDRYGLKSERTMALCRKLLSGDDDESVPENVRKDFKDYNRCLARKREIIHSVCLKYLQNNCESKEIAVTKLVRGSMSTMETLLKSLPNLKIIHLIRDPRGVALSRFSLMDASLKGLYSMDAGTNKTEICRREAALYCHMVLEDIKIRRQLETSYPGRIMNVIYEDFARNVTTYVDKIYKFIGKPLTDESLGKLMTTLRPSDQNRLSVPNTIKLKLAAFKRFKEERVQTPPLDSLTIGSKWKQDLNLQSQSLIMNECSQLYDTVKFE